MHPTRLLSFTDRKLEQRRRMATPERLRSQTPDHRAFGYDYFDNPAGMGYGGYRYDGRYAEAAAEVADFFGLRPGARVLEIGCAKGYLLVEFHRLGFEVTGIDLSDYCVAHAHPELAGRVRAGRVTDFDFPPGHFDLAICKEMLPHAEEAEAREVVRRMGAWARESLLVIQCISAPEYREPFFYWDSTHKLAWTPEQWRRFLGECGYRGYYNLKPIL